MRACVRVFVCILCIIIPTSGGIDDLINIRETESVYMCLLKARLGYSSNLLIFLWLSFFANDAMLFIVTSRSFQNYVN